MSCSGLRIAPDPQYVAEVIVMMTSLGAKPKEFYRSKQGIDLLEIKRAHYKRIDFNKDNPSGSAEVKVLSMLAEAERIDCSEDGDIHLPQIFIDGCNIGGHERLQELEDDGQLSYMLWRTACPNCFNGREPDHEECEECEQEYIELMPGVQTIDDAIEFGEEAVDTDPYDSMAYQAIGDEGVASSSPGDDEAAGEGKGGVPGAEEGGELPQGPSLADTMVGLASLEANKEAEAIAEKMDKQKYVYDKDLTTLLKATKKHYPEKEYFDGDYDEQDVDTVELDPELVAERRMSIQSGEAAQENYDMVQTVKAPVKRDSSSSLGDGKIKKRKSDESVPEAK